MLEVKTRRMDRFFLGTVAVLTLFGFTVFLSASLGLLAKDGISFGTVAMKQAISLVLGIGGFVLFSRLNYNFFRKWALFILLGAIAVNLLLFIPGLALHANGASRWINLGFLTFQPSELLKISFIIYLAAWAYFVRDRIGTWRYGLLPYLIIIAVLSALLLAQRDTDTLVVIAGTGMIMFVIAGMKIRQALLAILVMAIGLAAIIATRPYALERVRTYVNRGADAQGSGYQINQSLIAIGSGGWTGRGFGQSIQKFGYLPQPTDDSIFAVAAEEFGFLGSAALVALYVLLAVAAFRIGAQSSDIFGALVSMGIATLIIIESFMNIAAMLGLIPLSGLPLLFVSHGGTALIITLVISGMVANISRHSRT